LRKRDEKREDKRTLKTEKSPSKKTLVHEDKHISIAADDHVKTRRMSHAAEQ